MNYVSVQQEQVGNDGMVDGDVGDAQSATNNEQTSLTTVLTLVHCLFYQLGTTSAPLSSCAKALAAHLVCVDGFLLAPHATSAFTNENTIKMQVALKTNKRLLQDATLNASQRNTKTAIR